MVPSQLQLEVAGMSGSLPAAEEGSDPPVQGTGPGAAVDVLGSATLSCGRTAGCWGRLACFLRLLGAGRLGPWSVRVGAG